MSCLTLFTRPQFYLNYPAGRIRTLLMRTLLKRHSTNVPHRFEFVHHMWCYLFSSLKSFGGGKLTSWWAGPFGHFMAESVCRRLGSGCLKTTKDIYPSWRDKPKGAINLDHPIYVYTGHSLSHSIKTRHEFWCFLICCKWRILFGTETGLTLRPKSCSSCLLLHCMNSRSYIPSPSLCPHC